MERVVRVKTASFAHVGASIELAELDVATCHRCRLEDLLDNASGAGNNLRQAT